MIARKSALAVFSAALVVAAAVAVHGDTAARTSRVTFSGPVSLPGVSLGTGTYIFELTDPLVTLDIVTVLDQKRSRVYYTGYTEAVNRPDGAVKMVALGEAPAGGAQRVVAWYPEGSSIGHRFIYRKDGR